MGFKIGDNVAVHEDGEPYWMGRVVSHLGDSVFEVAVDGVEGETKQVSARFLRHLDSVRMRIAPPVKR
jgi:hypothetical protein